MLTYTVLFICWWWCYCGYELDYPDQFVLVVPEVNFLLTTTRALTPSCIPSPLAVPFTEKQKKDTLMTPVDTHFYKGSFYDSRQCSTDKYTPQEQMSKRVKYF